MREILEDVKKRLNIYVYAGKTVLLCPHVYIPEELGNRFPSGLSGESEFRSELAHKAQV